MTDTQEKRREAALHRLFPLYRFMDLTVLQLGDTVKFSVPLSDENKNHFGAVHAGVLFSLAEITGGIAVTQHRELADRPLAMTDMAISFMKVAKTGVISSATFSREQASALIEALQSDPRHQFEVPVELRNADGDIVVRANCRYGFLSRLMAKGPA